MPLFPRCLAMWKLPKLEIIEKLITYFGLKVILKKKQNKQQ